MEGINTTSGNDISLDDDTASELNQNMPSNPIIITSSSYGIRLNFVNLINRLPVIGTTIDPSIESPGTLEEQIIDDSFHERDIYAKVCSKEFINSLSVQKVSPELVEKKITCGICLEELTIGEDIIELPCQDKHYFHIKKETCDGIYPWLKNNSTCPLCRYSFPSTEVKTEPEPEPRPEQSIPIQPRLINIQQILNNVIQEQEDRMIQETLYESFTHQ